MEKEVTNNELAKSIKDLTNLVENLAISTAHNFDKVDKRFEKVYERFDDMDGRFDTLENNHEERLNKLEDKSRVIYTAFEKDLKIKLAS